MRKLLGIFILAVSISASFTACSNPETTKPTTETVTAAKDVSLDSIFETIQKAYGDNYLATADMPVELLETQFGLTPNMYEEVEGKMAMISTHPDRVILVKAKEGQADAVEKALLTAKDNIIENELTYPMNVPKTKASEVVRNGNYICYMLVGALEENMEDAESEKSLKFAQEETKKGVDAFHSIFK